MAEAELGAVIVALAAIAVMLWLISKVAKGDGMLVVIILVVGILSGAMIVGR